MATETLTGVYSSGVYVKANYTGVTLTSTAQVLGSGLYVKGYAAVYNSGFIKETYGARYYGIELNAGGTVENDLSASIYGYIAIYSHGGTPANIVNSGGIFATRTGVTLQGGHRRQRGHHPGPEPRRGSGGGRGEQRWIDRRDERYHRNRGDLGR